MSSSGNASDAEKARYWQRTISEAARSGMSIRAFCRQRRLRESQFVSVRQRHDFGFEGKLGAKLIGGRIILGPE